MVTALLFLVASSTAAAPVGVLQHGQVEVRTSSRATTRGAGSVLEGGAFVQTSRDGWSEISLLSGVRLRLSAGSTVRLPSAQGDLLLSDGRIWIQRDGRGPEKLRVVAPGFEVEVAPRASVIVERARSVGAFVAVRTGEVSLWANGEQATVRAGQAVHRRSGRSRWPTPKAGGRALSDLVANEAQAALSDPSGVQAFLLRRAQPGTGRELAPLDLELGGPLRSVYDMLGADLGTSGGLVEDGTRPPPFFEEEVPTKGPNLEVEVRFP